MQDKSKIVVDKARFTVIAPECIRMEYSESGKFVDARSLLAVNRDLSFKDFKVERSEKKIVLETSKIKLTYTPDGKPLNRGNLSANIKGISDVEWFPGKKNSQNLGGTVFSLDGVKAPIYLGEGLLSRDGWSLIDDSGRHIFTEDWVSQRPEENSTDWYLFGYGHEYKAALKAFMKLSGEVPMPRKYALGSWYSRYWPYSSKDYCNLVKEYQDHDFPLDIMVFDMDWHKDGWSGWSWNKKLLPDAEKLLKWMHDQGIFVTLNIHASEGVGPHEDRYEQFMKELGENPASKKTLPFDAGDKRWVEALLKHMHVPLEEQGVDFWWLDTGAYRRTKSIPDLRTLTWLNHIFYQHTSRDNKRGLSFSRWGGLGDHRNPIHFSGDTYSTWQALAFEVPFTAVSGNVGCFFWSHDIGGHLGPRNEENFIRWTQFGSTNATLRIHSTRKEDLDRRPWTHGRQAEDAMRIAYHLRSVIFPYIYSSVWQSCRDSLPLNRSMYLDYPENESSYRNPQQYFFGDMLLVAQIVLPGVGPEKVGMQTVWFPEGTWYNWFTCEKYKGGSEVLVAADINEFPIYVKAGFPLPLQPYTQRMTTEPLKELIVRSYPGEDGKGGEFVLYEDDGISRDYLKGDCATTSLSYLRQGNTHTVVINPAKGSYKGQLQSRSYVVELAGTLKAQNATLNGKTVSVDYDEKTYINRVRIPSCSRKESITVEIKADEADWAAVSEKAFVRRLKGLLGDVTGKSSEGIITQRLEKGGLKPDVLEMMLAIVGIGVCTKNEGVYLYNGPENTFFYNSSALVEGNSFRIKVIDQVGNDRVEVFDKDLKVDRPLSPSGLPDIPLKYQLGRDFNRILEANLKIKGRPVSISKVIAYLGSYLRRWDIVGPFDFDPKNKLVDQKYGPEESKVDLSAEYTGSSGKKIFWQKAECIYDIVDLRKYYHFDNKIAYAVTHIYSEKEQEVMLKLNTDDGVEVWLNGKRVHLKDVKRGIDQGTDVVKTTLKSGNNTLLLKISQHTETWQFRVAIESPAGLKESFTPFE